MTKSGSPRLRLTIRAPLSTTHWMARLMSSVTPAPSAPSTRAMTRRASGATPAMPVPLSVLAAAMPATTVPWPSLSRAVPSRHEPPMQSARASILPARSGCVASTPESTMPMVTPAPLVIGQASGAPIWVRFHC